MITISIEYGYFKQLRHDRANGDPSKVIYRNSTASVITFWNWHSVAQTKTTWQIFKRQKQVKQLTQNYNRNWVTIPQMLAGQIVQTAALPFSM